MVSKLWLALIIFLPLIMAILAYYLKDMSSRSASIVLSSLMFLISIVANFFKAKFVFYNFEIVLSQSAVPLMVSLSLLVASIACDKKMKEMVLVYVLGTLFVISALAGNIATFVSSWILSSMIMVYLFKIKPSSSIVILIVPAGYLIMLFHNFMQIYSGNAYSIIFVLFPFLASAIYPLNLWLKDLKNESPALSGIFFTFAVIPVIAVLKFASPFAVSIYSDSILSIITVLSILIIISAVVIKSTAISFGSVLLSVLLVLSLSGDKFSGLISISMLAGLLSFAFLSLAKSSGFSAKKLVFLGLPGGVVFIVLTKIIFTYAETDYIFSICLVVSLLIIILKDVLFLNNTAENILSNSRTSLAMNILFILALVIGIYSKPWFLMFDINKVDSKTTPMIFIEGKK